MVMFIPILEYPLKQKINEKIAIQDQSKYSTKVSGYSTYIDLLTFYVSIVFYDCDGKMWELSLYSQLQKLNEWNLNISLAF